ncbi:MAG: extracellular solute-binding protein [Gemmatimonadaceae bacterium]
MRRCHAAILGAATLLAAGACRQTAKPDESRIVVFNAGALALPLRQALDSFASRNHLTANQENAGSVETIRKVTDLGRNPDVIAVADTALFGAMLAGRLAGPVAVLGGSRLVLAFTSRSRFAGVVTSKNWVDVTTRPGVQVGRSDPALDPAGYRALMAMQLAERYYHKTGIEARLKNAAPPADMRPKSADLTALLQTGNIDYAWAYESVAKSLGLRYVTLPPQVDLGDPSLGPLYATASVQIGTIAGSTSTSAAGKPLVMHGAPIVFGAAMLKGSPNPSAGRGFITYLISPEGRSILSSAGLR